jgi:hypothetical protein
MKENVCVTLEPTSPDGATLRLLTDPYPVTQSSVCLKSGTVLHKALFEIQFVLGILPVTVESRDSSVGIVTRLRAGRSGF